MLVSINTNPASESTNNQSRFFNFMAALHSVATCAAGGTPTAVNPVKTSDGTKNTNFNCITVISNTEAGGWTAGVSNNITAATAYNASAGSLIVDLYNASGKSTYPYYRQTFGNFDYSFASGAYDPYPQLQYWQGCTSSNPASVAYSSSSSFSNGAASFQRSTSSWTSYPDAFTLDVHRSTNTTMYVAVTATYLIITTDYCMAYFGIREQAGWELTRTDNPPWVAFGFCGVGGSYTNTNFVNTNGQHFDYYHAWSATISPTGTQTAPQKWGNQNAYGSDAHTITGQIYGVNARGLWYNPNTYLRSLFALSYSVNGAADSFGNWSVESPVTDTVTGLSVPSAYPLIFNVNFGSTRSATGLMPGCLKGMSSTKAGLDYTVTASEYTINGQSYTPIRTGNPIYPDLFFLRKS